MTSTTQGFSAPQSVVAASGITGRGAAEDSLVLRTGGVLAVLGGVGYFVTLLLHGDLPDQTTAIALEHIAGRPEWPALKLSLIVFVLFWIGGFMALAHSMPRGRSWLLSRLAVVSMIVGATFVMVEYSIFGYGMKDVADAWAVASGSEREQMLLMGDVMLAIASGLFVNFIAWLIGLPYLLMGLAVAYSDTYPRWLGWIASVAGGVALFTGTTYFLRMGVVSPLVLYAGVIIPLSIWLAAMGILMWRRAAP